MDLSIVIPVYGCPATLFELCYRINEVATRLNLNYEIILVNDACPKGSWESIKKICSENKRVIGVNLSRNFGQVHATNAGLDISKGEWVVVMDCDLQDPPEAIADLYKKATEGFDIVYARRKQRKDNFITKFLSKTFYSLYNKTTGNKYDSSVGNLNIVARKVVNVYCNMRERDKSYAVVLPCMGFRQTALDVKSEERKEGKSSYTLFKKLKLALSLITSQSNRPLIMSMSMGFVISFLSFVFLAYQLIQYFVVGETPSGWTSIIVSIYFMSGLILAAIGLVGVYIGNIFNEAKGRPPYIIQDIINGEIRNKE